MRGWKHVVIGLALTAVACGGGGGDATLGADLFAVSCSHCHGGELQGGIGPPLGPGSRAALELTDQQIHDTIRVGPAAMPSFGHLTEEQVASLVEFLREQQNG